MKPELAESMGDRRTSSYAWGSLGKLYEDERRYQEALELTRRATFAAQQINAPESLYRWEWQTGRLLTKLEQSTTPLDLTGARCGRFSRFDPNCR